MTSGTNFKNSDQIFDFNLYNIKLFIDESELKIGRQKIQGWQGKCHHWHIPMV
jgi:hypothetical protein